MRLWLEAAARRRWSRGGGAALKLAGCLYGCGVDARNALYEAGILASSASSIPVVSVGGLTVGGSAKTPVAADLAGWLAAAGLRVAVVTHGLSDEMEIHRRLNPRVQVHGGRNRLREVERAAASGAEVALLDSGFQHRRLRRDLEIVVVDMDSATATHSLRLPAGPFRERWAESGRADMIVVVERRTPEAGRAPGGTRRADAVRALTETAPRARLERAYLEPRDLVPANEAAARIDGPRPAVAVAGVMWPEVFFREVRRRVDGPLRTVALPDHYRYPPRVVAMLNTQAGTAGVVCTLKDAVKLEGRLAAEIPLWYLAEELVWDREHGLRGALRSACDRLCGPARVGTESSLAPGGGTNVQREENTCAS